MSSEKPPYRVPLMTEIAALPQTGRKVISTFSGGGGSSLGYKMAGHSVLLASEFIPAARATYAANFPGTKIFPDDIRKVSGGQLLELAGVSVGELDIFDGSPPCASFSTSGKREKGWGKVKTYSDSSQRTDDLFLEYARLLREMQPKAFVAENVKGLVIGSAKGYFKLILRELASCGYRVEARVLNASWLGVPQARERLIFIGIRNDLGVGPEYPRPLPYQYTVKDALPWLTAATHDTSGQFSSGPFLHRPCPTVTVGVNSVNSHHYKVTGPEVEPEAWSTRYAVGREWARTPQGKGSDKYLNLVRAHPDMPSHTVTAMGGASGGIASVMHPTECRKFSIGELKRICGFPDDFKLEGTFAQKWERLGRAVPPVMMSHVARAVHQTLRKAGA